ncbi:hypothetical protein HY485_04125 [Candidatus Woesearchaeota archaeon]|nr:hypothetical protein [Candidatus Woesearchaeota archaeon]
MKGYNKQTLYFLLFVTLLFVGAVILDAVSEDDQITGDASLKSLRKKIKKELQQAIGQAPKPRPTPQPPIQAVSPTPTSQSPTQQPTAKLKEETSRPKATYSTQSTTLTVVLPPEVGV